jgi:hypothetical protein
MRGFGLSLLLAASLCSGIRGQEPSSESQAPIMSCPSTATLDDLIKAVDAAVSGPANKDRTCFRALFLPDARLIPLAQSADGGYKSRILTVDGWIIAVSKRGSEAFYEHQICVKSETYGQMAHLWSTYETRAEPSGKPLDRGINSIQAVYDGKQWRVIQIVWQAETPTNPLPQKYLP